MNRKLRHPFQVGHAWWNYYCAHADKIRPVVVDNLIKLFSCGTSALGFASWRCQKAGCTHTKRICFTCHSRSCPSCGKKATERWVAKQRTETYLNSTQFERHCQYWKEKYQNIPEPLFSPRYKNRCPNQLASSEHYSWCMPRHVYESIVTFAKTHQSTPFHVILAVLYVYFSRTTQQEDMAIGLPILNRSNVAFKKTLGLFTGISAIRFNFGTELSFYELLQVIGKTLKQDYRFQRFPISQLNQVFGLRKSGRQQLFDLTVSFY